MCKIEKECLVCKVLFEAEVRYVNRGHAKFCSRACFGKWKSANMTKEKLPNKICDNCGEPFYKGKNIHSKTGLYFCCRVCKDECQRYGGKLNSLGENYGDVPDYRVIAFRMKDSICERCGYDKYVEVLQVHHLDKNRQNNSLENLQILCPTCHVETHFEDKSGYWAKRPKKTNMVAV